MAARAKPASIGLLVATFVLAMMFLIGVTVFRGQHERRMRNLLDWVSHTKEVQTQLLSLLSAIQDIETGARGFVITGQQEYLEPFTIAESRVNSLFSTVRSLILDNPIQQTNCLELGPLLDRRVAIGETLIKLRQNLDLEAARREVSSGRGKAVMDRIRAVITRMYAEESALLVRRSAAAHSEVHKLFWIVFLGNGVSFTLLTAVFLFVLRENRLGSRAEIELREANQNLEERVKTRTADLTATNKELEAFSYSVSHDLRAPLRSIDGFSRILIEDCHMKLDEEDLDNLMRVRAASQRTGQLIDDLLQLSRLTRTEMLQESVDLSKLVRQVADGLQQAEPQRRVKFVIEPNLIATADKNLIRILLQNLLGNAWKFTGRNDEAKIEFGRVIQEGDPAFYVRDNGAGFDMTYAHKLFGAFQRLHSADEFPGTGIGLATVQRVILRHGGRVWAESKLNQGTTFYFTLPTEPKGKS